MCFVDKLQWLIKRRKTKGKTQSNLMKWMTPFYRAESKRKFMKRTSMASRKNTVTSSLTRWCYCNLTPSHRHVDGNSTMQLHTKHQICTQHIFYGKGQHTCINVKVYEMNRMPLPGIEYCFAWQIANDNIHCNISATDACSLPGARPKIKIYLTSIGITIIRMRRH